MQHEDGDLLNRIEIMLHVCLIQVSYMPLEQALVTYKPFVQVFISC